MKKLLGCILLVACASASADELADGIKAWESKDYAQAHRIFSKLAAAGNPEAQRQLGEMYGFGDGVPEDLAAARRWLEQARAGGSKDAAASLATVEQRASHKADIARYVAYDGSDVALGHFGCVKPAIPEFSATKKEITEVNGAIANYYACYGRFARNLNDSLPPGKAIPPETAKLMNAAEFEQAKVALDKQYVRVAGDAKAELATVTAAEQSWLASTEKHAQAAAQAAAQYNSNDQRQSAAMRSAAEHAADMHRGTEHR